MLPIVALPGTLLDGRSLAAVVSGLGATTLILGEAAALDDEVDRLAARSTAPAVWLGHSLGGIVALHLARRHPGSVAALVLMGANARAGRDTDESRRAAQWAFAQHAGLAALVRDRLVPSYRSTPGLALHDDLVTSLAAQAESVGWARFERQLGYARDRPGLRSPLHALNCPLLALSGEFDALCPPAQSDELVALVRPFVRAEHHMLAGAGHLFPMQHAGWAADRLQGFLASLEERNS